MILPRIMSERNALIAGVIQCVIFYLSSPALSETSAIEIVGDYRYAYHEPETAIEAKQLACFEALRQAISTTAAVRERTASIVDSQSFHNLIQTLATQHVGNQQILQQSEKGRTIYCKVKALSIRTTWSECSRPKLRMEQVSAFTKTGRSKSLVRVKTPTAVSSSPIKRSNASIGLALPIREVCGRQPM